MRLHHIMHDSASNVFMNLIPECREFFDQSRGLPLRKFLPETYDDIHRVKVRRRRNKDEFNEFFNEAFDDETHEIRQRAIFVNGVRNLEEGQEPFFVFPPNGFKFLYCTEVMNSSDEYQSVYESILDVDDGETFKDLLKFTYKSENLHEGLGVDAEIIIYNVPYFYAVRESVHSYDEVLSFYDEAI